MISVVLISFVAGLVTLLYAGFLVYKIVNASSGNQKMQDIANAIHEGADAFLSRQYKSLAPIVIIIAVLVYSFINQNTAIAFVFGVISSALAGYVGMQVSVRANVRVAEAAKGGLESALSISFNGGAVTGMALAGLGLIGISVLYYLFGSLAPLIGYGFGASLISLFARVGGGIYTKAADVGADLVGKVEKGIPEDDPRNPAVIADNVGDNVGDCAGMAADVFESFVVTIIAAMLLGSVGAKISGVQDIKNFVQFPLIIASLGVLASIIGSLFVKLGSDKNIMKAFYKGLGVTTLIILTLAYIYLFYYSGFSGPINMNLFASIFIGVIVTGLIFWITEYYTGKEYAPVKEIAAKSQTGAGTNLISGLALGLQSTGLPALVIITALALSYKVGGIYGTALAAASMLSMSAIVIAIDAYGPITDNAGGIAEMSGMPESIRKITDELDAVGNTTKATTKGFAIAGAALGSMALFAAFAEETHLTSVNLLSPDTIIGLFIGALLPFVFSSMLMKAVGRAADEIVREVRRQFKEIKGLMQGKGKPDYAKCVDISTKTAIRELVLPGIMAVLSPLLVGYLFGAQALAGLLAGVIASGLLLGLFMSTTGAAWDNAKKLIETGLYGGKGSDAHKAAVVGDTVGDPLKDTAGPSLNALIKVINTVSLVFAGLILAHTLGLLG